jgi:hypothetical protein
VQRCTYSPNAEGAEIEKRTGKKPNLDSYHAELGAEEERRRDLEVTEWVSSVTL